MKKLCLSLICVAIVLSIGSNDASARSQYKKAFIAHYKLEDASTDAGKALANAFKEAGCKTCHLKSKKKNNEYGDAMEKLMPKYEKTRWKTETDACMEETFEALLKLEEDKGEHGKSYGELLKAGELPTAVRDE